MPYISYSVNMNDHNRCYKVSNVDYYSLNYSHLK